MNIFLIKNNIVENVIVCESVKKAQGLFPTYECIEAETITEDKILELESSDFIPQKEEIQSQTITE